MKQTSLFGKTTRDKAILLKVTEEEKQELTEAAKLAHAGSVSGFIRQLALEKADSLLKKAGE